MKIPKKIVEEGDGSNLFHYYESLIKGSNKHKFVRQAPGESWYGSWEVDGVQSFLVILAKTSKANFYVYCCGYDDEDYAIRELNMEAAEIIFDLVKDGMSKKNLEALGFVHGG